MGGATLDEPITEGKGPKINGSVMLALAESKEEVLAELKKDVYAKEGVWDESKVCTASFLLCLLAWDCGGVVGVW